MQTSLVLKNNSQPLTDDVLATANSLYSDRAMDGLSSKYRLVPTSKVIDGMRDVGWLPVHVTQNRVVKPEKQGYQKHMIRFRSAEQKAVVGDSHLELVLINSHDGGSAYQLSAGLFRQVCLNGLVVGEETFGTIRFRHTGTEAKEIIRASLDVIGFLPQLENSVSAMKSKLLDARSVTRFCQHALKLRYPEGNAPIRENILNTARRDADVGLDVWSTTNRIQENLLNTSLSDGFKTASGRLRTMRKIRGIDASVSMNKALWNLASKLSRGDELPEIGLAE